MAGVDGSGASFAALDWAVDEALLHDAALRIVYAPLWEPYEPAWPSFSGSRPRGRSVPEHILATATERAQQRSTEVKVTAELISGDPLPALLREGQDASALVVAHRGRGRLGEQRLGSVALGVAAGAGCSVVVVRGAGPQPSDTPSDGSADRAPRVVLGVGPDGEPAAVAFAFREAAARGGGLEAVHAWRSPERGVATHAHTLGGAPDPRMRDAQWALGRVVRAAAERHPHVPVGTETPESLPRDALLAASAGAGLLVVGARRAPGASGIQLGQVSHGVLHHAPCPVAVVPDPA